MKILQLCNRVPYPPKDGGAIAMFNMTKALHQQGCEIKLLCLNTRKHFVDAGELPEKFKSLADFEAININTDVTPIDAFKNIFTRKSYHISRFFSDAFADKLKEVLQRGNFDIIQLEGLHISVYMPVIKQYTKTPIVLRAHNVEHIIWERLAKNEKIGIKKWYLKMQAGRLKKYELGVLKELDAIVAITKEDAQIFKKEGFKKPLIVSPTGMDVESYPYEPEKQAWPSLFHLGAYDWMPNQQAMKWFVEEVWPKIHAEYPLVKFYIAGRNMPDWMREWKIEGVEIVGEVENAISFINSKSMMVVPLQSGSGMRIKIIEGMALGKCIISTSIGAEGIDYEDGKNILIANTPIEFLSQIARCIGDRVMSLEIGRNARKLADKKYSNQRLGKELVEFYKEELL